MKQTIAKLLEDFERGKEDNLAGTKMFQEAKSMKKAIALCVTFPVCMVSLLTILLIACANGAPAPHAKASSPTLRLSYLPPTAPGGIRPTADKTLQDAQPLLRYLESETGARIELTVSKGYAASADALANNEADVAKLGGSNTSRRLPALP